MTIKSLRRELANVFTANNNFKEIGAQNHCGTILDLLVEQVGCRTLAYIVCGEMLRFSRARPVPGENRVRGALQCCFTTRNGQSAGVYTP